MKIGVIGAGKWGTALHFALSENPSNEVYITSRHPRDITRFVSLDRILEMEYLVFVIAAQQARGWLEEHFVDRGQKILIASKGIEASSGKFLNEVFADFIPQNRLAFLSGPSFAAEVMRGLPCALVVSAQDRELAEKYADAFPEWIKAYVSDDVIGAEVCGAYKNVIAIASGICDGLQLGNNARASLISRGLVEMDRFGRVFGAQDRTFLGLSGAGDLFLTASSRLSRNYRVGMGLAEGKPLETILEELGEVAEGVLTTEAVRKIATERNIYTPIATEVYRILHGKDPRLSLKDLLSS